MQCPECETLNRAGAKYCRRCGTVLVATPVPAPAADVRGAACAQCGASLRANARFCARCGQPVDISPKSPLPASPSYDGFAQPLSGHAVPMQASGGTPAGYAPVEYASPVYTHIPTPASPPARRRSWLWLWLLVGVILCVLMALVVVRVVMVLDLFPGGGTSSVSGFQ